MKKINYSKLAHDEGYDFSILPVEQQELTCRLYGGWDFMNELYQACVAYEEFRKRIRQEQDFAYSWGFPETGEYFGVILNCERSWKKDSVDYIMSVIVNYDEIKFIKFKMTYHDPVYKVIRNLIVHNPGKAPYFNGIYGRIIALEIENITESAVRKYNKPFSAVRKVEVLNDEEDNTVYAMFDLMLEQGNDNEYTEGDG